MSSTSVRLLENTQNPSSHLAGLDPFLHIVGKDNHLLLVEDWSRCALINNCQIGTAEVIHLGTNYKFDFVSGICILQW